VQPDGHTVTTASCRRTRCSAESRCASDTILASCGIICLNPRVLGSHPTLRRLALADRIGCFRLVMNAWDKTRLRPDCHLRASAPQKPPVPQRARSSSRPRCSPRNDPTPRPQLLRRPFRRAAACVARAAGTPNFFGVRLTKVNTTAFFERRTWSAHLLVARPSGIAFRDRHVLDFWDNLAAPQKTYKRQFAVGRLVHEGVHERRSTHAAAGATVNDPSRSSAIRRHVSI